jgi:D-amino peptidase
MAPAASYDDVRVQVLSMKMRSQKIQFKHILLVCDMEGSSECFSHRASLFMTKEWADACMGLTRDVDAVAKALFSAGVESVTVKDFHRSGYNIFTQLIDKRVKIISGYRQGQVPGMGDLRGIDAALFIGMHAPSGSDGFIAHTMTSRIAKLSARGKIISEIQLFSAALSVQGIKSLFFSGCPVACRYASQSLPWLKTHPIDTSNNLKKYKSSLWRKSLAEKAVLSLKNKTAKVYNQHGPFAVQMKMRDGEKAARLIAKRWNLVFENDTILFNADNMRDVYVKLAQWLYLTPFLLKILSVALVINNVVGKFGIIWAYKVCKRKRIEF